MFSRAAARTSLFSFFRFWITSSVVPVIGRSAVTFVERRFLRLASEDTSFLCALRYSAVHASFEAFSLLLKRRLHLAFRNRKTWCATCKRQRCGLSRPKGRGQWRKASSKSRKWARCRAQKFACLAVRPGELDATARVNLEATEAARLRPSEGESAHRKTRVWAASRFCSNPAVLPAKSSRATTVRGIN